MNYERLAILEISRGISYASLLNISSAVSLRYRPQVHGLVVKLQSTRCLYMYLSP